MLKPTKGLGRPRIDAKEKRVSSTFSLSPTVLTLIEEAAEDQGLSRSEVVNKLVVKASTKVERPEGED